MRLRARHSRSSRSSRSERFSWGIRTTATAIYLQARAARESRTLCGAGANQYFHQELQDFDMALGFLQARPPSIKPMLPQKKTMDAGAFPQGSRNAFPQFNHVLRILENRQPLAMLVRSNAFQSFEHFVSFQGDAALRCMRARKARAPNRISVQDPADPPPAPHGQLTPTLPSPSAPPTPTLRL